MHNVIALSASLSVTFLQCWIYRRIIRSSMLNPLPEILNFLVYEQNKKDFPLRTQHYICEASTGFQSGCYKFRKRNLCVRV